MRLIDADNLIPIMKYTTTDNEIGVFPIRIGFDAVVDFTSTHKLNRLTCVEEREGYCLNTDKSDTHKRFHFERWV